VDVILLTAVTVLMLVPVTMRNFVLEDRFILVATHGAGGLYWANNPQADPLSRDVERWGELYVHQVSEEMAAKGWTEAQKDSALVARARAFMREHPGRFLRNYFIRAAVMWSPVPRPWTQNEHTGRRQFLVAGLTAGPVLVLALLGVVVGRRRWWELAPFWILPVVLTLVFALFNTTVRYRLTFEPLLILLAASWVVALGRRSFGLSSRAGSR
jgi:hypothetical protein